MGGLRVSDLNLISGKRYHLLSNGLPGINQTGRIACLYNIIETGNIVELLAYASNYVYGSPQDQYCFLIASSSGRVIVQCNCIPIDDGDYEGDNSY